MPDQLRQLGKTPMPGQEARVISIPSDGGANMGIFTDVHEFAHRQDLSDGGKQEMLAPRTPKVDIASSLDSRGAGCSQWPDRN